jgi:hypothetical protein
MKEGRKVGMGNDDLRARLPFKNRTALVFWEHRLLCWAAARERGSVRSIVVKYQDNTAERISPRFFLSPSLTPNRGM